MSESNMQVPAGSIFICYRREDSADVTGRVYDRLIDHFGPERVFMDVEAIRLGYDFRSEIDETIKVCSIVIVVIGDKWLAEVDGKRRIDDENDRVRIEIEAALRREIPIIPVLTRGASPPTKAMLPASLEDLAYRHGTSIRHEHFRGDVDFLISQISVASAKDPTSPVKSTETTHSQPAIPPNASIPAITPLREPKGWIARGAIFLLRGAIATIQRPFKSTYLADLQKAADAGDADSQYTLGQAYEDGEGVPMDLGKAAELYQKAADQEDLNAQLNLAEFYRIGRGVPKDLGKAAELYQKAADQGSVSAPNILGGLYENGQGVRRDLRKAKQLYQKAADRGDRDAITNLKRLSRHSKSGRSR